MRFVIENRLYTLTAKSLSLLRFSLSTALDYSALHRQGVIAPGKSISMNITAVDNGQPRLSTRCTMIVNIIDINEENPYFQSSISYATMKENRPIGSHVVQIKAMKNSLLSKLTYSLTAVNDYFEINKQTVCSNSFHTYPQTHFAEFAANKIRAYPVFNSILIW